MVKQLAASDFGEYDDNNSLAARKSTLDRMVRMDFIYNFANNSTAALGYDALQRNCSLPS